MKRIVALGLYIEGYGFTRVFTSLFLHLQKFYEIDWIGLAYRGEPIDRGYRIHPNNLKGGDMYGTYHAEQLAERLAADYVLILNDVWMLRNYQNLVSRKRTWQNVAYIPLDGRITDPDVLAPMSFLDGLVAYTPGDAQQYRTAFQTLADQQAINHLPVIAHQPHGVDLTHYYPLDHKEVVAHRQHIFPDLPDDCIVILNANRFNERKNIRASLEGFAKALPRLSKPARLCLHTPNMAEHYRSELNSLIDAHSLQDHVIVNPLGDRYVSIEQLNILYNCCPIGINTSFGEGWGLISFEHGATGAAQIVPGHSAPASVWAEAALYLSATESLFLENNPFQMHDISTDDLESHLTNLVADPSLLETMQKRARAHAASPQFDWEQIAHGWRDFLEALQVSSTVTKKQ